MHRSEKVVFVSAGMLVPKKRDHPLARRQLYLNYGALTLATQLQLQGYDASLVHGEHDEPAAILERLMADGILPSRRPVLLSIPSFYALPWAQAFCKLLADADPDCRIVAGGRWVVGGDPRWFQTMVPEACAVAPGLGEAVIRGLVDGGSAAPAAGAAVGQLPAFPLNHRLVHGFEAYQPSVEASRGCGMGCAFCEERDIELSRLRAPATMAEFLQNASAQYGGAEIHPYLQSSYFLPTPRWADAFRVETARRGLAIAWRCETRVDSLKPGTVEALAAAGLKVLDLGMESASAQQVAAMRKARDPDKYLRRASDLLAACRASGVWAKVNVLLYAGETARTVDESAAWLDAHAAAIKGVSVGPVVAYGPPAQAGPLLAELEGLGARRVDASSAVRTGITRLHLSGGIDAGEAEAVSLALSRRCMDADAYFSLKAFSYYPRGYRRQDFDADVAASDPALLPFASDAARGAAREIGDAAAA